MSALHPDPAGAGADLPGTPPVPALLVMHADLAAALLRAVSVVYEHVDGIRVISNEGLGKDQLEKRIAQEVEPWTHGGLVLTDFWGGSCHICGASTALNRPGHGEIALITGVNLPMLLDYLHNRGRLDAAALAERLQQKGRDSIRVQRGPGG